MTAVGTPTHEPQCGQATNSQFSTLAPTFMSRLRPLFESPNVPQSLERTTVRDHSALKSTHRRAEIPGVRSTPPSHLPPRGAATDGDRGREESPTQSEFPWTQRSARQKHDREK
jgi:hypothetical protein